MLAQPALWLRGRPCQRSGPWEWQQWAASDSRKWELSLAAATASRHPAPRPVYFRCQWFG